MDQVVVSGLKDPEYNEEVITELGIPVNNIRFSKKLEDTVDTPDIIGVGGDRAMVGELLSGINHKLLRPTASVGLVATVLHEPKFYKDFKARTMERFFVGLDISDRVNYALKEAGSSLQVEDTKRFKKFKEESNIYMTQLISLLKSNIGSNGVTKTAQLRDFNIMPAQHRLEIPGGAYSVKVGPVYYYTGVQNQFAGLLIDRYKTMNNPLYVNFGTTPTVQNAFEAVLDLTTNLPLGIEARSDYVSKVTDLNTLFVNLQRIIEESRGDQEMIKEVSLAVSPYGQAINEMSMLSQVVMAGKQSGKAEIEVEIEVEGEEQPQKRVINVAEAEAILKRLSESGFAGELQTQFGITIPVTQMGLVKNYLQVKLPGAVGLWQERVPENINYVQDFEQQEATFYKQQLESVIKQFAGLDVTR